jgi:putative nucleotidyltransferase with HDIG domain
MRMRVEAGYQAELLGLRIRWALIGAAAALIYEGIANPVAMALLGLLVISNLLAHKYCKTVADYEARGRRFAHGLRLADGIVYVAASAVFPALSDLWLLVVPVILKEAIVSRDRQSIGVLAGTIAVANLVAWRFVDGGANQLAIRLAVTVASAFFGAVLASYKSRDEVLTTHDRRLTTVLDCGATLAASRDLRATILHILRSSVIETEGTCGYVMLIDEELPTVLRTEVAYSAKGDFKFPDAIEVGSGMSGYVAKMGQPVGVSSDSEKDAEYDGVTSGVRAAMSVPLIARTYHAAGQAGAEEVLGVLTILSTDQADAFDAEDLEMLRTVGSLLAVAVANDRMEERQRTTFLRTLESLATALEARDEYTRGHSQRVSEVSLMIGEKMGFSIDAQEELRIGTILHDIGKIGVPDAILNKRDRLTDAEFDVMKSHPVIGYEICKPLRLSEGVLMIIRNHHEKLDGSGYPDGLKGGELPLSLRIVCVADAFDAMSSRRPYRDVMELHSVMSEMSRCAGTQFDPVVVETLKELIRSDRMQTLYKSYWQPAEAA